jgi:uncharacterized membrane protein YeaQ/YmgE (transglycosylase-associated protein family)
VASRAALRPLGFGEIIDIALNLYGRHWRSLSAAVLVVVAPVQVVTILGMLAVAPEQFDLSGDELISPVLRDEDASVVSALLGFRLLEFGSFAVAAGACLTAIVALRAGDGLSGRRALAGASSRLGSVVGVALVSALGVAAGLLLLFVPGVWIATVWSLAMPVLLVEGVGVSTALRRSTELVQGRFWPILGLLALAGVSLLVVSLLLGGLAGSLAATIAIESEFAGAVAALVAGVAGAVLSIPVMAAILGVVYVDQRVRKEGFRGAQPEPVAPPPATVPPPEGPWQPPVPPSWPPGT